MSEDHENERETGANAQKFIEEHLKESQKEIGNPWTYPLSNAIIKDFIDCEYVEVPKTYYFKAKVRRVLHSQWGDQFLLQLLDERAGVYNDELIRVRAKKDETHKEGTKVNFVFNTVKKEFKGHPYYYTRLEDL
jgi:hypothetical protein